MSGKFYELFISVNLCIYNYFSQSVGRKSPRWKLVPTRREQEKWDRATKAATGGSVSHLYHFFFFFLIQRTSILHYCMKVLLISS